MQTAWHCVARQGQARPALAYGGINLLTVRRSWQIPCKPSELGMA